MPKLILFIFSIFVLLNANVYAQNKVTVKVTNIQSDKGTIYIGFYKPNDDFPNHEAKHIKKSVKPLNSGVSLVVTDLDAGTYAVAVLHDINDNDELDNNFIGIPKEPYGFSKNIHHTFSAPTFDECKFNLTNKPVELSIKLR
ncbi:MAG: DUF2141 domain-containing protein [Pseudomonadota bacterium]